VQDRGAAACSGTDPGLMALQALLMSASSTAWMLSVVALGRSGGCDACDAASGTSV
jgi:hypothetical protein